MNELSDLIETMKESAEILELAGWIEEASRAVPMPDNVGMAMCRLYKEQAGFIRQNLPGGAK